MHDTNQSFTELPVVRELWAERAKRYTFDTVGSELQFIGSDTLDPREETFMEVTHFHPLPGIGEHYSDGSRFLLITNRLCWPVDTRTYGDSASKRFDLLAPHSTFGSQGLGAIDVRRPRVLFSNHTDVLADSLIVERISATEPWIDTIAVADTALLPWLRPGRGGLFRVQPLASGVSLEGVAFNNAVRSENPSTDTEEKPWIAVVERDSAVYLRTFSSAGGWSREHLISDDADSAYVQIQSGTQRSAHNTLPAVATTRNDSATMIVWQRADTAGLASVEALYIPGPPTDSNLAGSTRLRLSALVSLSESWMQLTPAVTGTDDGWAVAWASPTDGIDIVAVRNDSAFSPISDVSSVATIKASAIQLLSPNNVPVQTVLIDSTALFPTLAYVSDSVEIYLGDDGPERRVHLAWQQSGERCAIAWSGSVHLLSSVWRGVSGHR